MPIPSATDTTLTARAGEAIKAYIEQLSELTAWRAANPGRSMTIQRHDSPHEWAYPLIAVRVTGARQRWAGGDEFSASCVVLAVAQRDTDAPEESAESNASEIREANQSAIQAVSAIIERALEDQDSIRGFLNADNLTRPVKDFHFYAFTDFSPDIDLVSDDECHRWRVVFERMMHFARVDYSS